MAPACSWPCCLLEGNSCSHPPPLPLRLLESAPLCRLRKDPLDPIDGGTKVRILFKRLTDPEVQRREEEARKRKEEEDAKVKAGGRASTAKAGAWSGLPPARR